MMVRGNREALRSLHFTGGRFEESVGWLDFDVLNELLVYKRILIATARELWMSEHRGRERLPKRFADEFRLGIGEIEKGSCIVHVECIVTESPGRGAERLYDAAGIVDATLLAAQASEPFPNVMADSVLPIFVKWGKALTSDESIVLGGGNSPAVVFNSAIRERIISRTPAVALPAFTDGEPVYGSTAESILGMFDRIRNSTPEPDGYVPPPSDLAKNLKHYLYGFPKENA